MSENETKMTESEQAEYDKALANLRKLTTMADHKAQAVALNKFRDHLVASYNLIATFNKVVSTIADFRGDDFPVTKVSLRKSGAGRKAADKDEATELSKLLG